jgi:hypothetical protein
MAGGVLECGGVEDTAVAGVDKDPVASGGDEDRIQWLLLACLEASDRCRWSSDRSNLSSSSLFLISGRHLLTLFPVEHTNALDRAVVRSQLAETPSTGRSNRLGGRSNRLGQERRRKPRFAAPGGTPSGTTRLAPCG